MAGSAAKADKVSRNGTRCRRRRKDRWIFIVEGRDVSRLRIELGKGCPLGEILAGMRMVAEGVGTTAALLELAREAGIELPITEQVDAILSHGKSPREAIRAIMERPLRRE